MLLYVCTAGDAVIVQRNGRRMVEYKPQYNMQDRDLSPLYGWSRKRPFAGGNKGKDET